MTISMPQMTCINGKGRVFHILSSLYAVLRMWGASFCWLQSFSACFWAIQWQLQFSIIAVQLSTPV